MDAKKFEKWVAENGTSVENFHVNRFHYKVVKMLDGWYAIFDYHCGNYDPLIQANGMEKVMEYINLREPIVANLKPLIDKDNRW